MNLQFLGATGTVTGSKYLVESGGRRVLIDCGLFQGLKELRLRNRAPFPVPPSSIDAVVLTHAHLDHTGYLPVLVRDGFEGPVLCTAATRDLCEILLADAGWLQEEEARFANRHGFSKHKPALPLFTRADADRAVQRIEVIEPGTEIPLPGGLVATLGGAGHILGACWIHLLADDGRSILFSGDLGRPSAPVVLPPSPAPAADVIVCESTYGDRRHPEEDPAEALARWIAKTASRGGVVLIPAFAVGRTQALISLLARLVDEGRIPRLPTFLDSPMARDVTRLLTKHGAWHHLSVDEMRRMSELVEVTNSVEDSKAIDARRGPMIIISASGMATGGRVLHHLKVFAPDHRNLILFAGYQAAGTRGAAMVSGAESVKIHGGYVPIGAEVAVLDGLSAHADWAEILAWLEHVPSAPRRIFLTHGEPSAADALRRRIEERLSWNVRIPDYLERFALG